MTDTNGRLLRRMNLNLPGRIEAALFGMRLDKLTVEPSPYGEALRAIGAFGATANKAMRCECEENNTRCRCYLKDDDDV